MFDLNIPSKGFKQHSNWQDNTIKITFSDKKQRSRKIIINILRNCNVLNFRIVSGSRDATLRIWSLRNGKCLRILRGHSAAVRCVQYNGKYVVSGSYDHSVKVWNPLSGKCIHTLTGHTNKISTLVVRCFSSLLRSLWQRRHTLQQNMHLKCPLGFIWRLHWWILVNFFLHLNPSCQAILNKGPWDTQNCTWILYFIIFSVIFFFDLVC